MFHNRYIGVTIATDIECDDFDLQADVQRFLRLLAISRRQLFDWLIEALRKSETALFDQDGNRATLAVLSEADSISFELWTRDYIKARPSHIVRRNRPESLERRRFLITILRVIFPMEATTWGRRPEELGLILTDQPRVVRE